MANGNSNLIHMNRPNLFIVGAPKCGTTSLAVYLQTHPDIFVCDPKEPHFFAGNLPGPHPRNYVLNENKYIELFSKAEQYFLRAEASTWYLYAHGAAEHIKAFSPDARIIIMVRHPVDMMFSLYSHRKYAGDEDAKTFEEAIELEPLRKKGKNLPRNLRHTVVGLFYREVACFAGGIRHYIDVFGQSRVYIVDFERFKKDTIGEYSRVLTFLEVPITVPGSGFAVFNENKRRFDHFFYRFIDDRLSSKSKKMFKQILGDASAVSLKGLFKSVPSLWQESLNPQTAEQLEAEFSAEIRDLSMVARLDLSEWFKYRTITERR